MEITVKAYPAVEGLAEFFSIDYNTRQPFFLPNPASFLYLPLVVCHLRACFQWSTICGNWHQVWPSKTDTKIRCWSWIPPHPAGTKIAFLPWASLVSDTRCGQLLKHSPVMNWDSVLLKEKTLAAWCGKCLWNIRKQYLGEKNLTAVTQFELYLRLW